MDFTVFASGTIAGYAAMGFFRITDLDLPSNIQVLADLF